MEDSQNDAANQVAGLMPSTLSRITPTGFAGGVSQARCTNVMDS
jgi:hypothetical protein